MSMISSFIAFDVLLVNGLKIKTRIICLSFSIALFSALRAGGLFKVYFDWLDDDETHVVYCYIHCNGLWYM